MIGFTLKGHDNYGFYYYCSRWTEGSLWLAKQALSKSKNKVAALNMNEALIDAIEGQFKKLKELKFEDAVNNTPEFVLQVFNDFNFSYKFDPKKSPEVRRFELLQKIASCKNDMGDQVALALFECIENYKAHYVFKGLDKQKNNFLNVYIDL
jgi:hypothetical protein